MKILFSLLFILVNSQQPLSEHIKKLIQDNKKCSEGDENIDNKELCYSISNQLSFENSQCCILTMTDKEGTLTNCSFLGGTIEQMKLTQTEGAKAFLKETFGFSIFGVPDNEHDYAYRIEENKIYQNYKCKDGELSIYYGYDEYTDEDQSILKSEKHCLYYFHGYALRSHDFMDNLPTQEDCFNADMLQSSKDSGIKCSYFNFTFKDLDGNLIPYSTCYFYNRDSVTFDERSTAAFKFLCINVLKGHGNCEDYSINLIDEDGNTFRYNSLTGQVEKDTSSKKNKKSGTKILAISKFIFLIFLFLK